MASRFVPDLKALVQLARAGFVQTGCMRLAQPEAARIRAATSRRTGETADSTRVEPYDFGKAKGAVIVQDGAGVILNFGNENTRAIHQATPGGR